MTFDRWWLVALTILGVSSPPPAFGLQGAVWVVASLISTGFLALAMWRWTQK